MFHSEHHCEKERARLERIIERLLTLIDKLVDDELSENQRSIAAIAVMKLDNMNNATKATFTEFAADGVTIVRKSGPITFASDNVAVATVDSSQQVDNPDGSTSVPVVSVAGASGVANITGVDPASANKVAAGDVDNVSSGQVATSAKLVLS